MQGHLADRNDICILYQSDCAWLCCLLSQLNIFQIPQHLAQLPQQEAQLPQQPIKQAQQQSQVPRQPAQQAQQPAQVPRQPAQIPQQQPQLPQLTAQQQVFKHFSTAQLGSIT